MKTWRNLEPNNLEQKLNEAFLVSDTDLDGGSAVTIAKVLFPDITYATPERDDINSTLKEAILSGKYNTILMTDCSPTGDDTIELINEFVTKGNDFVLLDHHKTALELNKYSWSRVKVETNGHKHCGAELLYELFKEVGVDVSMVEEFVELVRSYDTWDWFDEKFELPNNLNKLYWFLGLDKFILNIASKIYTYQPLFDKVDEVIIKTIEALDNQYIDERKSMYEVIEYEGMKVAVLFTDRCVSQLGNVICRENTELDFCCLVDLNRSKCSMRSVVGKADVSVIAKRYGGGGHEQASGFTLNENAKQDLLKNLF